MALPEATPASSKPPPKVMAPPPVVCVLALRSAVVRLSSTALFCTKIPPLPKASLSDHTVMSPPLVVMLPLTLTLPLALNNTPLPAFDVCKLLVRAMSPP